MENRVHCHTQRHQSSPYKTEYRVLNVSCKDLVDDFKQVHAAYNNQEIVDKLQADEISGPASLYATLLFLSDGNSEQAKVFANRSVELNPRCRFGEMVRVFNPVEDRDTLRGYPSCVVDHSLRGLELDQVVHQVQRVLGLDGNLRLVVMGGERCGLLQPSKCLDELSSLMIVDESADQLQGGVTSVLKAVNNRLAKPLFVVEGPITDVGPPLGRLQDEVTIVVAPFVLGQVTREEKLDVLSFARQSRFVVVVVEFDALPDVRQPGNACEVIDAFEQGIRQLVHGSAEAPMSHGDGVEIVNWFLNSMAANEQNRGCETVEGWEHLGRSAGFQKFHMLSKTSSIDGEEDVARDGWSAVRVMLFA